MLKRLMIAAALAAAVSLGGCQTTAHATRGNVHMKTKGAGGPDKVMVKSNPAGTFVKVKAK